MSQDATKVLLGSTGSSDKYATVYDSDPADFPAGTACRLNSSNGLSVAQSDGAWVGVSLGRSLSDTKKTSVLRCGKQVPIRLTDLGVKATGTVTITNVANLKTSGDAVIIGTVSFIAQDGAVVQGDPTFRAHGSTSATASSLADQINTHADTKDLVIAVPDGADVVVTAKEYGLAGNSIIFDYTDNADVSTSVGATLSPNSGFLEDGYEQFAYVVQGDLVEIDDVTGLATEAGSTTTSAAYYTDGQVLNATAEDGTIVPAAYIDMIGGL